VLVLAVGCEQLVVWLAGQIQAWLTRRYVR